MQVRVQHRILIENGHVLDPSQNLNSRQNLYIENDKIVAIGEKPADFVPDDTINANGQLIIPGMIDLCAFLAEPGFGQKGSIASETAAAA